MTGRPLSRWVGGSVFSVQKGHLFITVALAYLPHCRRPGDQSITGTLLSDFAENWFSGNSDTAHGSRQHSSRGSCHPTSFTGLLNRRQRVTRSVEHGGTKTKGLRDS